MANSDRWYFTKEKLYDSPSRRCGIDAEKELSYRQQAANFIQDMGQRLQVTQLCINTAIVYMHRFYIFHSFSKFHRNAIAACAIFLAAKVEEQPRKLEHVIKVAHYCLNLKPNRTPANLDVRSPEYARQANELVVNENIMLQTLGFDIAIEHPHTSVVKCCQLVRASKDLAQTSYFMATNSLHLTTMCLQYRPTVVACVCIHLACKWASWEIPVSNEGKAWFFYVDNTVTLEILEKLTAEFLAILDKCPSRLRRKMLSGAGQGPEREKLLKPGTTQLDDKKPIDSKHPNSSASMNYKFPDPSNPQPSTSGSVSTGASLASAVPSSKDGNMYNKNGRKDNLAGSNAYSSTVTSSSSVPSSNNMHSSQYDKKEVHSSYAAYKDKKEMDRKLASQQSSLPPQSSQHNMPHGNNKMSTNESKPLNHPSYHSTSIASTHASQHSINEAQNKLPNSSNATKQQQIAFEKQRLMEERSKIRNKPNEDLWNESKPANSTILSMGNQLLNNGSHNKSQSNSSYANQAFYDNLLNDNPGSMYQNSNSNSSGDSKHFKTDSFQSNENEDSCDLMKRDAHNDLKMEFSDNESNQSPTMNLTSISSLMMPEQSNGYTTAGRDNCSPMKNAKPKNSFMSIFAEEEQVKPSLHSNSIVPKSETSFELKNHMVDYTALNSMLDYQMQQQHSSKVLSPLKKEEPSALHKKVSSNKQSKTIGALQSAESNNLKLMQSNKPMSNLNIPLKSSQSAIGQTAFAPQLHSNSAQSGLNHPLTNMHLQQSKIKNEPKTPPKSGKSPRSKSPATANINQASAALLINNDVTPTHTKLLPPTSTTQAHSNSSSTQTFAHQSYLSQSSTLPVSQNSINSLSNPSLSSARASHTAPPLPPLPSSNKSQPPPPPPSSAPTPLNNSSSSLMDQSGLQAQLPLLNQLPPPVALELPPLPPNFSTLNKQVKPDPYTLMNMNLGSMTTSGAMQPMPPSAGLQALYTQTATGVQPTLDLHQAASIAAQSMASGMSLTSQTRLPHTDSDATIESQHSHKHSSKSKDKDKERSHEKHHKHHKEKKHKHKSKDKHKDKHKDKDLKITLAVEKSGTDDLMNNNQPIRLKILKKPLPDESSVGTSISGDNSEKKGLKIIIPKASLSSSSDRKRRNSPKESSRSASKAPKLDESM